MSLAARRKTQPENVMKKAIRPAAIALGLVGAWGGLQQLSPKPVFSANQIVVTSGGIGINRHKTEMLRAMLPRVPQPVSRSISAGDLTFRG